MKRLLLVIGPLLLANYGASAATTAGASALAMASLVADRSPLLSPNERTVLARLFDDNVSFAFPARKKILVRADSVVCRSSDVDIALHGCTLTFGKHTVALKGRRAHELYATVAEAGVPSHGAAGSIYEALSHLVCTVDPHEVRQRAGGGADCSFDPGP